MNITTIRAAADNDMVAIAAVIDNMEPRVLKLAAQAARRIAPTGPRFEGYREEFAQVGRIALFQALSRFTGDTVDAFHAYAHSTIHNALLDAVREERNPATGADKDALKIFASMLERADGDVYLAEKLAQSIPPAGRRLSADRASAARLSWQGSMSLQSAGGDDMEPMKVLEFSESARSTYGVPEDLIAKEDLDKEDRAATALLVNAILDSMGEMQREVLRYSFGIGGHPYYGHGDRGDDVGLAQVMGTDVQRVRYARNKGLRSFAKRYVKAVARNELHAAELTAEADKNLSRGGRK